MVQRRAKKNSLEARTETLVFRVTEEEKKTILKKKPKGKVVNTFLREVVQEALEQK